MNAYYQAKPSTSGVADIVSYVWQAPEGIKVCSLNQPTLSFAFPSVDEVRDILITLKVTDALGNSNNENYTLHVRPLPKITCWDPGSNYLFWKGIGREIESI